MGEREPLAWIPPLGRLTEALGAALRCAFQRPSGSHTSIQKAVADIHGHERFRWVLRNVLWSGLGVHALFLALFFVFAVWPLAVLNVASLLAYLLALRLLRRGEIDGPFTIGALEVVVHAAVATLLLGLRSGFFVYVPVLTILTFLHPRPSLRTKVLWGSAQALAVMAVVAVAESFQPTFPVGLHLTRAFAVLNTLFLMGTLAFLAHVVTEAAKSAERDLRQALARVDELARTDTLTGLLNRRAMSELLEAEATRVARHGRPFAVLVADLDDFKGINDACGHPVGDHVLRCVAQRLLGAVRAQDEVARWGGEEFLLLLPETDLETGLQVAERLRRAVSDLPLVLDGSEIRPTTTLGVAVFAKGSTVFDTIRSADRALYVGKGLGKDRVVQGAGRG